MHYYNRHIGDYAKDTGHLSLLEHGAYTVLLDWAYNTGRPLPSEDATFRICRAITKTEQEAVRNVVQEFFPNGVNKRVQKEIEWLNAKSEIAKKNANDGWKKRLSKDMRTHSGRIADALPNPCSGNAIQSPIPNPQSEVPPIPQRGNDLSASEIEEKAALVYEEYPKKVGKPPALKAIGKAIKAEGFEVVFEATKKFARLRGKKDPQFIPNPATWFNQARYLDDPATWGGGDGRVIEALGVERLDLRQMAIGN